MFRLVGTAVVLSIAFAILGVQAGIAAVPTDANERAAQPALISDANERAAPVTAPSAMTDAHQRAPQPTPTALADAHDRVLPAEPVAVASPDTGIDWTKIAVGTLIGAGLVLALASLAVGLHRNTPRGHPPLAHR